MNTKQQGTAVKHLRDQVLSKASMQCVPGMQCWLVEDTEIYFLSQELVPRESQSAGNLSRAYESACDVT